ncbi:acetyl-CoA carboxylase, carboxyltransferase subunit beta [Micromonospora sp. AP08]|uniref:acetyl-CoA carboxylase, carboxyltransferase subunit beta n=1 Tax=Micromonospora sp. AP08 TaxID=2604467 RepID=UPI0011D787D9|nr:acetyl-CoA carboxylase, carboxyltransferase subunit beta [Micromonospora sp. AP08]TYB39279.1 acetyl-CoA carboxylase, carboxyltransferase subunit beta [Micromonospora sp. AP08]
MLLRSPVATAPWVRCEQCRALTYGKRFTRELGVCPECGRHSRLTAAERIAQLLDEDSARPVPVPRAVEDPLRFADDRPYRERHAEAVARTGMACGVAVVRGRIEGHPVVLAVMDFRFMGGSLGAAEGEAVTTAAETALADRVPLVVVTASGGARMQEGTLSLMQMAKTSNAYAQLDRAGLLTVTVITDPTYGGVAASFATLGDVVLAERGARMGFAGRRVIEQTIREELPEGFQTAEHLLARGLVDDVRPRVELRPALRRLLAAAGGVPAGWGEDRPDPVERDVTRLAERAAWDVVQLARDISRPTSADHLGHLLDGFCELRGDRSGADCRAVVAGIGLLDGLPVMGIGHQKGHTTRELVAHQFGMPSPAGFRKAARAMRLAEKLGIPVVTLVDTPGAYPGVEAEENGQAVAIAENLRLMGGLRTPVVAVVTGEGGSGGALALAVADVVLMSANAVYSVISPEGCASILWRDAAAAPRAAESLGVDARSLLAHGVVDGVVPEPPGGSQQDPVAASELLHDAVTAALAGLLGRDTDELVRRRVRRFRGFGSADREGVAA